MEDQKQQFMQAAIDQARKGMEAGEGGPFGAIVVKDGVVVGRGNNKVTSSNDPTAHAEVTAIRDACKNLNSFQLDGCVLYSSCEPCPMCLGAIYWARPDKLYFACSREDAAEIGFDDDFIYKEIPLPIHERKIDTVQIMQQEGLSVFKTWTEKEDREMY